ncbi:hypothetical protein Tco_1570046 [Tanacetum coccineum]
MDLYHSRFTPDDLNDLIIKYKIPCDLHPWLPSEDFVMSELPDDAIGIYHRMFDFSGVRIPFSSFLLALIKHYRVHFSQLDPLGLNKVITFEVLCRSLQIEPTVTLFRVFQSLCKQEQFFFIDHRAILDAMVWRHPDAAIDDPRPAAGSFNMADVRRLSAYVIKLRDMPKAMGIHDFLCLPEWTGAEVQEEPHLDDLAAGIPSSKIVAKAEASQKRKASTSGATSSYVAKRTRVGVLLLPQLKYLTPKGKGIMVDDAAAPSVGASRPRPSSGPAPSFRNVSGDSIHTDFFPFSAGPYYATYPVDGVTGNCEFTREEWDAPYRPTFGVLTKEVFKDPAVCKTIIDQFPTPREMVQLLARYRGLNQSHHEYVLSIDSRLKGYEEKVARLTGLELQVSALKKQVSGLNDKLSSSDASFVKSKAKGKERKKKIKSLTKILDNLHSEVARLFAALNQATVLAAKKDEEILRLKTTPLKFSSFFHGQFQGLVRKFLASDEFSRGQGELLSLAASAGFERGLSMHRTKDEFAVVLKKMANFMPGAQDRLAEASILVAQTDYAFLNKISEHATEPFSVILQLEPEKLVCPANILASREVRVSPPPKELTVTPASKSLELSTNVNFTTSAVASEHNEEMGISIALDDAVELVEVGSGRVSSGPNDVVVALSSQEKGDGLDPSSIVGEEVAANPSGV